MTVPDMVAPARRLPGWKGLAAALVLLVSCGLAAPATAEAFRIGSSPTGILIWIADRMGAFADAGVDVELERITSGVEGAERAAAGGLELTASSEFAFTSKVAAGADLCIYAALSASRTVRLLARADRVGPEAGDLTGKRIGVTYGSAAAFFLSQYLALEGVPESEVQLVDLVPRDMVGAMTEGTIDAVIVWEPYVTQIREQMPDRLVEYADQALQHYYFVLNGRCSLMEERPEELRAVLQALRAADRLAQDDPDRAKALLAPVLGVDGTEMERIWALHSLAVSLPQDLLSLIELESRWLVATGRVYSGIDNALQVVRPGPLEAVAPSAVQIVW